MPTKNVMNVITTMTHGEYKADIQADVRSRVKDLSFQLYIESP